MQSKLDEIVANKRLEVEQRKNGNASSSHNADLPAATGQFRRSLLEPGIRVIAEIKPKSPSAGDLRNCDDIESIIEIYSRHAAGISVLTDEKYFGGSLALLEQVVRTSSAPVLCKEFVIDEIQIHEARRAGAEAVLLIVKILDQKNLLKLIAEVERLGMTPVVEVQTKTEVERALEAEASVMLINNRNLQTFEIDLDTTKVLAPTIPNGVLVISASGIETRADIDRLLPYTNKFLIGSSLMRSGDVESTLRDLCIF